MTTKKVLVGGSFAPPLTADKLKEFKLLSATADVKVSEVMLKLIEMVEVFNQTPTSQLAATPHVTGLVNQIPLEDKEITRIWNYVPWDYEIESYSKLFETINNNTNKPLRDACFHLLWFARELEADREPITNDKLPAQQPSKLATTV